VPRWIFLETIRPPSRYSTVSAVLFLYTPARYTKRSGCRVWGFVRIVIPHHITIITLRLLNFGSPSLPARTIRVP
jgi:hypothetical protein